MKRGLLSVAFVATTLLGVAYGQETAGDELYVAAIGRPAVQVAVEPAADGPQQRVAAAAGSTAADDTEYLIIEQRDGTQLKVGVGSISQLYFEQLKALGGKVGEPVDLGLSVKWANWDIGASREGERGGLFGWADPSGKLTTTTPDDYPSSNPPENISGTNYDIARAIWGSKWRMPTYDEICELYDKCTWYQSYKNGDSCLYVVGPNGNGIYLPLAGSRYGTDYNDTRQGSFWSGTLESSDPRFAWAIRISSESYKITGLNRLWGFCVRPVYGKAAAPATTLSVSPASITMGSSKGSTASFQIVSNAVWTISGIPTWMAAAPMAGNGSATVTLTAQENYEGAYDREAVTLTVKAGSRTADVRVSQKGIGKMFSVEGDPVSLAATAGATGTFTVRSNVAFSITSTGDWLEVAPASGNTTTVVTVKAKAANPTTSQRTAIVTVGTDLAGSERVTVTQAPGQPQTLYREPYLNWGATKAQVKSNMSGYTLSYEDSEALMYDGRYKESMTMYSFKNGALDFVGVTLPASAVTQSEIESALRNSGYTYLRTDTDGDPLYKSADQKTVVYITYDSDDREYFLLYMPESSSTSTVLFEQPCINWGTTPAVVKNFMSGYTLYSEDATQLLYRGRYEESMTMYGFEDGKLWMSGVVIPVSATTMTALEDVLEDAGFAFQAVNDGIRVYLSSDGQTLAEVGKTSDGDSYIVAYSRYTPTTTVNLYRAPYTVWGASVSQVKSYMSDYTLVTESASGLGYLGKYKEEIISYTFQSGKLEMSVVSLSMSAVTFGQVDEKIEGDGYAYSKYDSDNGGFLYVSADKKNIVLFESDYETSTYYVYYSSADLYNRKPDLRKLRLKVED